MENRTYYHEQQILGRCAIHTVNNLFQAKWMTYEDMCNISLELYSNDPSSSMINPYQSVIPYWGQFDIQCLIKVIESRNCLVTDHLIKLSDVQNYDFYNFKIKGLIVNVQTSYIFNVIQSNHWFAILKSDSRS